MKRRKFASAEHARRSRELDASWEAMMKKYPPMKTGSQKVPTISTGCTPIRETPAQATSLNGGADPVPVKKQVQRYEGEMLARELAAREEYERKKARVAPIGNKMGNQYLSDSEYAAFQKGELRRRP